MNRKPLSVVAIDDSEIDALVLKKVLSGVSEIGEVTIYQKPQEALEIISRDANKDGSGPELILLDIMMPEMDGFEWLDELEDLIESDYKPVIFILSSTNLKRHHEDFQKQHISQELLTKPLDLDQLKDLIKKHFPEEEEEKQKKFRLKF